MKVFSLQSRLFQRSTMSAASIYDQFFDVDNNVYTCKRSEAKCKKFRFRRLAQGPTNALRRHLELPMHVDDLTRLKSMDNRQGNKRKATTVCDEANQPKIAMFGK